MFPNPFEGQGMLTGGGYQVTQDDVDGGMDKLAENMQSTADEVEKTNRLDGQVPPVGTFILKSAPPITDKFDVPSIADVIAKSTTAPGGAGFRGQGAYDVPQQQTGAEGQRRGDVLKAQDRQRALEASKINPQATGQAGWAKIQQARNTQFVNDFRHIGSAYDDFMRNAASTGIYDYNMLPQEITYEQIEYSIRNAEKLGREPLNAAELLASGGYARNPDGTGLIQLGGRYDVSARQWLERPNTQQNGLNYSGGTTSDAAYLQQRGIYSDETGMLKQGRSYVQVTEQGAVYRFRKNGKGKWTARKARSRADYGRLARRRAYRRSRGLTAEQQRWANARGTEGGTAQTVLELRQASG